MNYCYLGQLVGAEVITGVLVVGSGGLGVRGGAGLMKD